jgi:hypothetical protein
MKTWLYKCLNTGKILHEFPFENHLNIVAADESYKTTFKTKVIPSTVICYCKEFPTGGWAK